MNNKEYKYYKFNEGRFFRLDEENYNFQVLKEDNLWEDDDALISIFLDAASDYYEIKDEYLLSKLKSLKEKNKVL